MIYINYIDQVINLNIYLIVKNALIGYAFVGVVCVPMRITRLFP